MVFTLVVEKSGLVKELFTFVVTPASRNEKMCCFTEPPQYALSGVTIETKMFIYDRIVGWCRDMRVCRGASLRGRGGHELPRACREVMPAVSARAIDILLAEQRVGSRRFDACELAIL
jgi:hypothetical protein